MGDYDAHDPFVLDVDVADLCNAFAQAMRRYINLYNDDYNLRKSLEKERISLTDRIKHIKNIIRRSGRISFRGLVEGCATRENVVVTFLALLELVKERKIVIEQVFNFSDIIIRKRDSKGRK